MPTAMATAMSATVSAPVSSTAPTPVSNTTPTGVAANLPAAVSEVAARVANQVFPAMNTENVYRYTAMTARDAN